MEAITLMATNVHLGVQAGDYMAVRLIDIDISEVITEIGADKLLETMDYSDIVQFYKEQEAERAEYDGQ